MHTQDTTPSKPRNIQASKNIHKYSDLSRKPNDIQTCPKMCRHIQKCVACHWPGRLWSVWGFLGTLFHSVPRCRLPTTSTWQKLRENWTLSFPFQRWKQNHRAHLSCLPNSTQDKSIRHPHSHQPNPGDPAALGRPYPCPSQPTLMSSLPLEPGRAPR